MFNLHKLREIFFLGLWKNVSSLSVGQNCTQIHSSIISTLGTVYLGHYLGEDARCILGSLYPPAWPFHPQRLLSQILTSKDYSGGPEF